jgi:DNA-binding GntR family transcriptional regulator
VEGLENFNPQYSTSLVKQTTDFLTNAIIEGRLPEGQRLIENELQRKFGISRGPIRESLRILEKNGLVISIPRKGTFVRKITQEGMEEIFPIIAVLQGLAARLAVSHLNNDEIVKMELALSKMVEAAKKRDIKRYVDHHSQYHQTFIYASKNNTLITIIENLRHQYIWFTSKYLHVKESFEYGIRAHREIIDLFIKKDIDRLEHILCDFQKLSGRNPEVKKRVVRSKEKGE